MTNGLVQAAIQRGNLVKICGLRQPEHAAAAAAAGADLIGFIFAPARRQVSAATARECIGAAREAARGRHIVAVGVFVDAPADEVEATVREAGLDLAQLSGLEPPALVANIGVPAVKAIHPKPGDTLHHVLDAIDRYRAAAMSPVAYLVDGFAPGAAGGTGTRADWDLAAELCQTTPTLLAGGLDPGNVVAAIERVRPLGVDVSSGVEHDGIKDPAKIEAFIREAKQAFLAFHPSLPTSPVTLPG